MTRHLQYFCTCSFIWILAFSHYTLALEKWSRQLEATDPGVSDNFDWIPLAQPADSSTQTKDRTGNGRVLTYSQAFPSNGHFSDFNKGFSNSASPKPTPFDFPYHFQNFPSVPQTQALKQHSGGIKTNGFASQEPTSQSFFKFEMPLNQQNTRPNAAALNAASGVNTGYQISHAFGGGGAHATLFNSPLFNQQPVFPPEFHPIPQKPQTQALQQQKPSPQQNFLNSEPISLKNFFKDSKQDQPSNLQAVTPQVFPQIDSQGDNGFSIRNPFNEIPSGPAPSAPSPQQDLQYLYVPYNDIFNQIPQSQAQVQPAAKPQSQVQHQQPLQAQSPGQSPFQPSVKVSNNLPTVNPYQINQFYTPEPIGQQRQPQLKYFSSTTSTTLRPPVQTTSLKPTNVFQNFVSPQYNTTPKPKPKAHQPPLAMFLLRTTARPSESDVVDTLSSAKVIAVLDGVTQNTPEIFVGPSGMPTPSGYTKFDLPYLSQLQGSHDISDVAFFVAPLSYRTREGFNKILLPEPHVGSIVINLAKSPLAQQPQQQYYQPQPQQEQTSTSTTTTTTHRPRTLSQRIKSNLNRGNKFSYYYDQDPIQEVASPQVLQKERPKKKRPQSVKIEQPGFNQQLNNPYAQFNPIPNQISNDDFYKLQTRPASTSTTSSTTTTSTTSTTAAPQNYFLYNTQPELEFPGASGHLYPEINQISQQPQSVEQEQKTKFTTRPPVQTTTAEEEYRMKQYYKKQEANRNRPYVQSQTNSPYEQVQYTPVNLEYEISKTTTTTTNKPRITFFSPTAAPAQEEQYNTLPPRSQQAQPPQLPANHRPSYIQNEITDNPVEYEPNPYQLPSELPQLQPNFPGLVNNLKEMKETQPNIPEQTTQEQTTVTPQIYQEPETSTKPTRRPINRVRKPVSTRVSSSVSYSESESSTRKPINRINRRPYGSRNTASTASPINMDYDETSTTTTRRPSSARNPLIRNPNRIRYQPTPEERHTLRIKPKRKHNSSGKVVNDEDLDYQRDVLKQNYPVFKPTSSRRPSSSPTAIPTTYDVTTTEVPTSETQQVYTVTPSNSIDNEPNFPAGLLEPMQIAQQYNEYTNNYGPGYFPNQEDVNPTEPIVRNEINPVYNAEIITTPSNTSTTTTTTTTTTEAPIIITTRRSPFIRRNYPRFRTTTTTEAPTSTTPAEEEKPATRNRLPPRKVIKVRARTRRPLHPASPTPAPAPEEENEPTEQPKQNYRRLNRFNQDLYENETPRRRYKQKFQLEGQESQWSPPVKVGPTNNFKPINPKDSQKNQHKFENEPEIVTAGPATENNKENYEVKVSANYGPSKQSQMQEPNLKPEKSFAELLEEVMGKAPEEKPAETTMNPELSTDGTVFEAQKTTIANRILRRGKWKKTRVSTSSSSSSSSSSTNSNGESFETAESQNLGNQLYNSLHKTDKPTEENKDMKTSTTTPMTTAAEINAMFNGATTTPIPISSMEEYSMTTSRPQDTLATTLPMNIDEEIKTSTEKTPETTQQEESATRRMDNDMAMEDDLEIQPSLFSEVKKQLHELFSIEESDDTAVTAALAAVGKRRQEYTNIKRPKVETTTAASIDLVSITQPMSIEDKKAFHRELMKHVVYATSSPVQQEETSEAEICYRGRCIKSDDIPANHKLN